MIDDLEKKVSLDELPEEGSSNQDQIPRPPKKKSPPKLEPRIEKLKKLNDASKLEAMTQSWHFDERRWNFGWVGYISLLLLLETLPFYENYLNNLEILNDRTFNIAGDMIQSMTSFFESFIRHPLLLIFFTPIFFSFKRKSDYAFDIRFDGIQTVKSILPYGSKENALPVFIQWKEILRVEKGRINEREVLRLYSQDGKIGEIYWRIDLSKKKAIKLLLAGLISHNHPMRKFVDNEKELM